MHHSVNDTNVTLATHEIGAFVGGEVRGSAQAIYIDQLQRWMFFLTTYVNMGGEQVVFKLFDAVLNQESGNKVLTQKVIRKQ